jgi:hypothetical protein
MLCKEAIILLKQVKDLGYKANDWEKGFILSILTLAQRDPNKPLSYKQSTATENIYRKAAGGGSYEKRQYGYRRP